MTVLAKQERAALLEWRGSTQSSSSEQGGSYGQYTRTEATAPRPNQAAFSPKSTLLREGARISKEAAGSRSADAAAGASDRAKGTVGLAPIGSGFVLGFHPSDLLPHCGLVAGGTPYPRHSHHSEYAADRRCAERRSRFQLSSGLLALALVDVAAGTLSGTLARRALRTRWNNLPGRRRNSGRPSRQESLRQKPASRRRAFVAFVHRVPLRPQVGRAGSADPFPVRPSAVGLASAGSTLPQQGLVETTAQNTVAIDAANAQSASALVSRAIVCLCRRRWLRHPRVGAHSSAAAETPTPDLGQSFLSRCQSLLAACGACPSQGRTTSQEGKEAAIPRAGRGTHAAATAVESGLVRWWPAQRRSRQRHGPLVQDSRRLGRDPVDLRPRSHRHAPRRILLHDRRQSYRKTGDRILYRTMVDRDDLPGNARLPWAGNDSEAKERNRVARSPMPVRFVHGRGGVVRPDAGSLSPRGADPLGRQDRHNLLGRHHCCASLVVARMGFCNPRSYTSLCKTRPAVTGAAARRSGAGGLAEKMGRSRAK